MGPSWITPRAPRESVVAPPEPIAAFAASAPMTTYTMPFAAYPARPSMARAGDAPRRLRWSSGCARIGRTVLVIGLGVRVRGPWRQQPCLYNCGDSVTYAALRAAGDS